MNYVLYSGRISTLVAMASYIFRRPIMVKVKIDIFYYLKGGISEFFFLQKCLLCNSLNFVWLLAKSPNLICYQGDKKGKLKKNVLLYLANSQVSVYRTTGPLVFYFTNKKYQRTNGPVKAHLISGSRISTQHSNPK